MHDLAPGHDDLGKTMRTCDTSTYAGSSPTHGHALARTDDKQDSQYQGRRHQQDVVVRA